MNTRLPYTADKRTKYRRQSGIEKTTETIQDEVDDLVEKEERNDRVRASVSRLINLGPQL
ncbi:hypothetical protein DMJ13_26125 [halophilic archaeon]|nr:hypothetical protein DMJ13_26125 [halophilic archaeon]